MATVRKKARHSKVDAEVIKRESAAFLRTIGDMEIISLPVIADFLKNRKVVPRFGKLILNELIRTRHLVKMGQKYEVAINYIVVSNLPVRVSGALSDDTFSRIIGSSMTFSATAARLVHNVSNRSAQHV